MNPRRALPSRPELRTSVHALPKLSRLAASTLLGLSLLSCGEAAPRPDLLIRDVTVIDVANGVRAPRDVLIDDGRIVAISEGLTQEADQIVDGTGRYLIPGLWDFHVHFTYDERLTDAMAALFLRHGITSVRDTGGPLEQILPVVERLRAPGSESPRVFFAGPLLDGQDVVYDGQNRPLLGIANADPEEARANVRALAEAGVDFVKIYEMVTPEVFEALASEATQRGLPIDGHVPLAIRAREVGPRVQSLEHLRNLELDCVAEPEVLLAERRRRLLNPRGMPGAELRSALHSLQRLPAVAAYDQQSCSEMLASMKSTIQVPTLRLNALGLQPPFSRPEWPDVLEELPDSVATEWGAAGEAAATGAALRDTTFGEWSLFLVGLLHEAEVPIGAGTDTPIGFAAPGFSLHSELEMLVRAGLTPLDALEAATVRPAQFFGLDSQLGAIEPGYLADLVLLKADPLEDIANTRQIEAVVSRGQLLSLDELRVRLGANEASN